MVDAASAEALVEQTGCDGIMIGRGAEGNPWIFKQILHYRETGETLAKPTQHEVKEMMLRHARMQVEYKGGGSTLRGTRRDSRTRRNCAQRSTRWRACRSWNRC